MIRLFSFVINSKRRWQQEQLQGGKTQSRLELPMEEAEREGEGEREREEVRHLSPRCLNASHKYLLSKQMPKRRVESGERIERQQEKVKGQAKVKKN